MEKYSAVLGNKGFAMIFVGSSYLWVSLVIPDLDACILCALNTKREYTSMYIKTLKSIFSSDFKINENTFAGP